MKKKFQIRPLDLIALDDAALAAILIDPVAFLRELGAPLTRKDSILQAAQQERDFQARQARRPPWIGYLAQELDKGEIVGVCSYKGNPTPAGIVEITFHTFADHTGGGYASGMAQELLVRAFGEAEIQGVIAHTAPVPSAATAVLEKVGLRHVGETDDPEADRVWRWELSR